MDMVPPTDKPPATVALDVEEEEEETEEADYHRDTEALREIEEETDAETRHRDEQIRPVSF